MTDPAVEQARAKGGSPGAACYAFWPHELAALEAALRRQHFLEAAALIEAENDREETGDTPICYAARKDAAQFLRALTDDPSPPTV